MRRAGPLTGPIAWLLLYLQPDQWLHDAIPAVPALLVLTAAGLILGPLTLLLLIFGVPALGHGLIPRDWRRRYRGHHGRRGARSAYIPAWMRRAVHAADRHRCTACGQTADLVPDHYLPWRLGGLTSVWNLLTLCADCNRAKSCYWEYRNGDVVWGFADADAPLILAAERRARRRPARWLRLAWAL